MMSLSSFLDRRVWLIDKLKWLQEEVDLALMEEEAVWLVALAKEEVAVDPVLHNNKTQMGHHLDIQIIEDLHQIEVGHHLDIRIIEDPVDRVQEELGEVVQDLERQVEAEEALDQEHQAKAEEAQDPVDRAKEEEVETHLVNENH